MTIARALAVLVSLGLAGCSVQPPSESLPQPSDEATTTSAAAQVQRLLTGRFDSSAQAERSPSYYAVQLAICPALAVELGPRVLYVEQALMDQLDQPYRQRLYVVEPGPDPQVEAVSRVFELAAPEQFVGRCALDEAIPVEASETLERDGCTVELAWIDDHYQGSTPGTACESDLHGASYATSEVELYPDHIRSWDRGFDAEGEQVWGATEGGYLFERRTPLPAESTGN